MQYHSNATTNIKQREMLKRSGASSRQLAKQLQISHVTTNKWKQRDDQQDRTSRPHTIHYAVEEGFWKLIKVVRKKALFSLDDLLDALEPYIPNLKRGNCYRILKHYRLNKFSKEEKRKQKKFATYKPGFVHIDLFYLPKLDVDGKKKRFYCFLAIDRATRMLFLEVYPRRGKEEAADFLIKCMNYFPYKIHRVLTDNGREFTLRGAKNRWGDMNADSYFDLVCELAGIKHKLTKVKHPWTNGMAERAVRTVREHTTRVYRYQSPEEMAANIKSFQDYHNFTRRQRVLNRKTPFQVTMDWFVKEPDIFTKDPMSLLPDSLTT